MNKGGFSLSRLLGISSLKSRISKNIGIPLTKSGRDAKLGRMVQNLFASLLSDQDRSDDQDQGVKK